MKPSQVEDKAGRFAIWKPLLAWSFFGSLFTTSINAQPPPDQSRDEHQGGCAIRRNDGQVKDADQNARPPLQGAEQWGVRYPFPGNWTLTAYDATGRQISTWTTKSGGQAIDLSAQATGIYLLRATEFGGTYLTGKVLRP